MCKKVVLKIENQPSMACIVFLLTSNSMVGDGMDRSILLVAASSAGTNILTINLMVISNLTCHMRCWQTVVIPV